MRFIFQLILCLLFSSNLFAQTFPAPGALWYYQQCNTFFPFVCGPAIVQPAGQAIISGQACTEMQIAGSSCLGTTFDYVYESNDTIYHYLPSQLRFTMLYDFNALAGDVWNILNSTPGLPGTDSVLLHVDSTGFIQINSVTRKIIYTSYVNPIGRYFNFEGPMVAGIGSLSYFFPQFNLCDPQTIGLRCYDDSLVGHYQPNMAIACDSVVPVGIHSVDDELKFSVYPNPYNEEFTVYGLQLGVENKIQLIDFLGRTVLHKVISNTTVN